MFQWSKPCIQCKTVIKSIEFEYVNEINSSRLIWLEKAGIGKKRILSFLI